MHILLTDILTCPRCGPSFGLIVLADEMADRRVLSGRLGCANCRTEYPVRGGVVDLRLGTREERRAAPAGGETDRAFRLAALSGVGQRPGTVVVRGAEPALVAEVARLLPAAQLVGASAAPPAGDLPPELSWIVYGGALPFRDRSLLALAQLGAPDDATVADALRALFPGGRLVVDGTAPETAAVLIAAGWSILLEQEDVAVASGPAPG